jgi:excisionase family DNA binding protein
MCSVVGLGRMHENARVAAGDPWKPIDEMTAFLTAQQVQELIQVDKSTVYRMAEDGRLPGVKVGRQWRFPADRVADQFGLTRPGPIDDAPAAAPRGVGLAQLLVPDAAQSVADLMGELFGIMSVVTDMDGHPLSAVANPCGYYATIASRPETAAACLAGWKELADDPHIAPRWLHSHLDFLCARTFVWVDRHPVGMILVGGVTPESWPPPPDRMVQIAAEVGLPVEALNATVHQTWDLTAEQRRWILHVLPQVGELISQLASARSQLLAKLDAIAALAAPNATRGRD